MSDHLHPGPDTLSAFVEGVLPEHERAQCLAHLAECSRCREIVFAVQDTPAVPVVVPVSIRPRRLPPMPLLAAAAAVCFALLGAWFYLRSRMEAPREQATVRVIPPSPSPARPAEMEQPKPIVTQTAPQVPRRRPTELPKKSLASIKPPTPVPAPEVAHAAPLPPARVEPPSSEVSVAGRTTVAVPAAPPIDISLPQLAASETSSGISGTVTDPTGAAVPEATVELRQLAGNSTANTRTDKAGSFKFTGLAPGRYELRIQSAGFRLTSQQVEVRAREIAAVEPRLEVGATTQSVEVSAASSTIQTESSSVSRSRRKQVAPQPRPLPSKLPAETTVTHGKIMLSVDSAGTLFLSGNSGRSWKAIKPLWSGKITDLITPPDVSDPGPAQFQLTTEADADWLSRDGRHWYPAPPEKK